MTRWGWIALALLSGAGLLVGVAAGSTGWQWPWAWGSHAGLAPDLGVSQRIVWDIRLPRSLGAWLVGALLGLSGAVAQGLFRNPLADPFLLGSSSGAALGVALALAAGAAPALIDAVSVWGRLGLSAAAFVGAMAAVLLTLSLSRGTQHTARLLLAGIVTTMVLGALTQWVLLLAADVLRAMQAFLLGNTALLSWAACEVLAVALVVTVTAAWGGARVLDALALGEDTARSLGLSLGWARAGLVMVLASAAAVAVAQAGVVAFVGLVAPHWVRAWGVRTYRHGVVASAAAGGGLLLWADVGSRTLMAPQDLPVGVLTAVLGGGYLLWLMHRRLA